MYFARLRNVDCFLYEYMDMDMEYNQEKEKETLVKDIRCPDSGYS